MSRPERKDLIITGGGLAGLSLARQLKNKRPELEIAVIERNSFPVPEKTAKVGESTVEIGSRYLKHTLGMGNHFTDRHLRKHGLRCFFGEPQKDFAQQDELGVSQLFGIPTYQIDRGAIENHLQTSVTNDGVDVIDNASISELRVDDTLNRVSFSQGEHERTFTAPWIVDAAGRQALLKNKLGLTQDNNHKGNALWFRIDAQIKLDEWSHDTDWQARIKEPNTRWLSTNHLMGPGYWVWVIPLDNGATSIGIVMDDEAFASGDFKTVDGAKAWLAKHQPRCAEAITGADVLDYVVINGYSHSCKQMFSEAGWGVTGESGVFADPFYSPGSDFIAFNNTFLTELITTAHQGNDIRFQSRLYQSINQSFFDNTLSIYEGQYGGFGDRRMMSLKLVWDYSYYWGVLSLLFFREVITDVTLMRELSKPLMRAQALNQNVQAAFRERAKLRVMLPAQGLFMNQFTVPCLKHFSAVLENAGLDITEELPNNVAMLERIATHTVDMLSPDATSVISDDEFELFADYRKVATA